MIFKDDYHLIFISPFSLIKFINYQGYSDKYKNKLKHFFNM